ncbi:MAG: TnsA endonuclease N-terminal domain-containing protein [Alicyclobacillus macrosporangiidus]|uniref:TnsA endonuclease C-terminal domain-containing protein n=1 Tax=Alicyclobacillus macrosporangiidus TaxID=392015 RepID=UPI0026E99798|nr:TnsA endonuclease C-terminal domain-containing protein [Alicyclobacillus macrosporangiidus]MCL6597489.1 TnsA endonuclease N-terminal domain-containing protein [Alicyclobacillus macrosporangiidus]
MKKKKKSHKDLAGKGHGRSYTPGLTVRDVPSRGLATRAKGWKTGRIHHFMSNLELSYFHVLEWATNVVDIREKYPLPIEATMDIATRIGVKHPRKPKTQTPAQIYTDFVVDVEHHGRIEVRARTVIPEKELSSRRMIERLEIERCYWDEQGIDWGIVTENEIPMDLSKNVEWVHSARDIDGSGISIDQLLQVEPILFQRLTGSNDSLASCALEVDSQVGFQPGTCLWITRFLIANRLWVVDMNVAIETSKPLLVSRAGALSDFIEGVS